jgi:hypothetical protein
MIDPSPADGTGSLFHAHRGRLAAQRHHRPGELGTDVEIRQARGAGSRWRADRLAASVSGSLRGLYVTLVLGSGSELDDGEKNDANGHKIYQS